MYRAAHFLEEGHPETKMFNTLKYAKILQEVGFTQEQSEATVVMLSEVMEEKLATKDDLISVRQEIASVRQELVELREKDLQILKSELIIKMGAMQAASIAIIVALIKIL
jgi:hypothetical protein